MDHINFCMYIFLVVLLRYSNDCFVSRQRKEVAKNHITLQLKVGSSSIRGNKMQSIHKSIETKSRKICSVPQCSSYCTKDISLHAFPSDPKLSRTWKTILKIGKPVTKHMLVCSQHFTMEIKDHESLSQTNDNIVAVEEVHATTSKSYIVSHIGPFLNVFTQDMATQTAFCDYFELPQILNSDAKLINFCGITFDILKTISKCVENTANFNKCNWPNIEAQIILVLCKLKIIISFACLAILFNLSNTLCRSIFYPTVSLLAVSLKPAIYWPTKEEILNNMPHCFQKFKNTRVVLDCTEIKIQKLKCLKCRVASYSHYKGMHTLKYLIGITPSGLISFVSAGFGGRATDKAIFNYEKLIDKLDIHDAVMVDKGILIENECNEKLVKLIRPPFYKKQKQFSKADAEATADIARARVHVERAI